MVDVVKRLIDDYTVAVIGYEGYKIAETAKLLKDTKKSLVNHIAQLTAERDVLAAKLIAVTNVVHDYEEWHIDSPEDSWRFERDLRSTLGMPQAGEAEDAE